ncbi:MAG: GvpL/GvpF family gas vesicle protein [Chloroflexi bacterium]|nr:GvpL/GvpF family gas vesicle protein [Chloroflexota bacterium]
MDSQGKYLYCIIRCPHERTFDSVTPMGNMPVPVFTVPHDGLSLVVSDSPVQQYETTRAHMMAHERVLERVMKEHSLLPVRFGTVADPGVTIQGLQKLLQTRVQEFHQLLADIDGKAELGLKALWQDEKAIFSEVLAENPSIRRLRDSLAGRPAQAVRYEGIRLGQMVKDALERKRKGEAAHILAQVQPIAVRTRENVVVGDRMVLNAAFLVETTREGEFDQAVRRLEQGLGQRLAFKYVGPVPPYNFVNIVVNWERL